jgi:hypothetical protein
LCCHNIIRRRIQLVGVGLNRRVTNALWSCSVATFPLEKNWQHYNRQDGGTADENGNSTSLGLPILALPIARTANFRFLCMLNLRKIFARSALSDVYHMFRPASTLLQTGALATTRTSFQ